MNGDETLSNLRSEICRNADARAVGLDELEELVHRWATAQNKAPMAERAAELAQAMANCGADTWGDVREFDKDILADNIGLNVVDAKRFAKFLASAQHDPAEGEPEPLDEEAIGSVDSSRSEEGDEEVIVQLQGEDAEESAAEEELEACLDAALQAVESPLAADSPVLEEEEAEEEGDLYDYEGAQALQEMLEDEEQQRQDAAEEAAAALAAMQRGRRVPAAAAATTKGGSAAEEVEVSEGPASQISGDTTESAMSHMTAITATVATAMSSMAASQRAMQAAAAQAARGTIPPLRLQDGKKPSVKATRAWIRQVLEKLQDVPGMVELVEEFLRDPRSFTAADMHGIDDPGGHIMMQVKGAAYGVYKKMGGKEREKVGVLLYNIYTSSWKKDKDIRFREMTDFQEFPEVKDIGSLRQEHARWENMLLEVMHGEFAADETVVESAREVFCKFQPMLAYAMDAGKKAAEEEGEAGIHIPAYLEAIKFKVSREVTKKGDWVKLKSSDRAAGKPADWKEAKPRKKGSSRDAGVCFAFQKGACKFGSRCNFKHVKEQTPAQQANSAVVTAPAGDPASAVLTAQVQTELSELKEDVQALTGVMKSMLAAGAGLEKGLAYSAHARVVDPKQTLNDPAYTIPKPLPKPRQRGGDSLRQEPTGVKWGPGHDLYDMIIKPKSKDMYQSKRGEKKRANKAKWDRRQ